jgi:flagellar protein FlbB
MSIMARTFLLLLLIAVVVAGGLVWFDHLGLIDIKTVLAPVYKFIGLEGRSQPPQETDAVLDLNNERMAVLVEANDLRARELEKQRIEIESKVAELEQMAAELETRQKSLDERDNSMQAIEDLSKIRNNNIEQNARALNGMPPQNAVAIIAALDDQVAIDILRKTEEIAKLEGTSSIVPFWLSLMPPARAADLQRKMIERPD